MADHLVVGAGTAGWEAGTDLFLDLARRLADDPGVTWCWVGRRSRGAVRRLDNDVDHLGLGERLRWAEDATEAGRPSLVVVTARTAGAAAEVVTDFPTVPTVGWELEGNPAAARASYPDVDALARLVRELLDATDTGGAP